MIKYIYKNKLYCKNNIPKQINCNKCGEIYDLNIRNIKYVFDNNIYNLDKVICSRCKNKIKLKFCKPCSEIVSINNLNKIRKYISKLTLKNCKNELQSLGYFNYV